MKSVRLTDQIRRNIAAALLQHRFADRQAEVEDALKKLGDEVYWDVYPKAARDAMAALPNENFLPRTSHLDVVFGTARVNLPMSEERPFSYEHYTGHAKAYGARDPKSSKFFEVDKKRRKLAEEREEARVTAVAFLKSYHTTSKLVEAWPECAPFAAPYETVPAAKTALTVPVRDLNKLFDL